MKLFFLVMALLCAAISLQAEELLKPSQTVELKKPYWGVARNSSQQLLLLASDRVDLGEIRDGTFQVAQSFRIVDREPLRIFSYDCNADGQDEIVVSALERGVPSSLILSLSKDEKFTPLFVRVPWHLAVLEKNNTKILLGQKSRPTQLFAGNVRELSCDGKIVAHDTVGLPRGTKLFEFTFSDTEIPPATPQYRKLGMHVITLEGNALESAPESFIVPHQPLPEGIDEKRIAGSVLDSILDKTGQNEAELWALIAPKGQPNKRLLLRYELHNN